MKITLMMFVLAMLGAGHLANAADPVATVAAAPDVAPMSDGEVRKIDLDTKKVTIKHGELKNLDMPPMTMVFQIKEPALLEKVKVGDKIKFRAEKIGNSYMATAIEVTK